MKLYYAPASSFCQRALIAIYEKQARVELIEVDAFTPPPVRCWLLSIPLESSRCLS